MLTMSQLREKGFRDQRWTAEDKRDQIQDVIKLHTRDKQQTNKKVEEMRKRQYSEIRSLTREVQEYRGLLDSARLGDKQMLRNTLRRDRPTQLAFMDHSFEKAIEHLEQSTFTLSKDMDKLRCLKKQRARQLLSLETEMMNLQRENQSRTRQPLRDAHEQALTSQITNCVVKQNAAASVNHTYQKILGILRKDTVYFDAVLGALHTDQVTQCRCVVRATQLGQSAAEDVARLREEAKAVETDLKHNMLERASAVKAMRGVVDHNKRISKSHVRTESSTDLRLSPAREDDGAVPFLRELHQMEGLMQRLQATTLVSSYLDVFPRFEAQLRQRQRLLKQVERRELVRDEVLARRNHAHLILHDLKNNMSEGEQEAEREEAELRAKMAEEEARREAAQDDKQKLCTQMVSVRTALYSIVLVLNEVKPTQSMAKAVQKRHDWELDPEFIDDLYARKRGPMAAPEANAMAMLKSAFIKVGVLLKQLEAKGGSGLSEVPDDVLASRAILPAVVAAKRERVGQTEEEIGALMLDSADSIGDAKVPTRESIRAESVKIIRMARKLNEPESYERIKRVRREEKWI